MRVKRMLCCGLCLLLCCVLGGCSLFPADTDKQLSPPGLTGDDAAIARALKSAVGGSYVLQYPTAGDRRSPIVLEDLDGDGVKEALVFYRLSDTDEQMHFNLIRRQESTWQSAADLSVTAGTAERIDFCDLDGDGVSEILVGWEILTTAEKQVGVYDWTGETLERRTVQRYTEYRCVDFIGSGKRDLLIQQLSVTDAVNRAVLFRFENDAVTEISSCFMDRTVKSIQSLTAAKLSDGRPAVFAEELKNSGAITEVLLLSKGELVNPLLDATAQENTRTAHNAALAVRDINHDGVPEIPTAVDLPPVNAESTEKSYYTVWCSFDGEGLTEREVWLVNLNDNYYIKMPQRWDGKLMVDKDSKRRYCALYAENEDGTPGDCLVELLTVDIAEAESTTGALPTIFTEVLRMEESFVAAYVHESASPAAITLTDLRGMLYQFKKEEIS